MIKKISYEEYYDKVFGGWIGKFIGGTIGGPVEGQKSVHKFTYYSEVPTAAIENDDNDFQLVWLHTLQERGIYITSEDLMEEWLAHITYPMCEYGYAVKNFRRDIKPPVSGWFNNDYFKECMGCPVRSEIWAFIALGNPKLAAEYAQKDGVLDHAENSVWIEMFLSALQSMAFFEKDIRKLLDIGLNYIPKNYRLAECVNDVIKWHKENESWFYVRRLVLNKYGSPDMTSALQNFGITVLALLYGKGDFEKTMLIAANCGYDSDCTCATAGAIIGIILGNKGIPSKWKDPMQDRFKCGSGITGLKRDDRISSIAKEICQIGLSVAKELNKNVKITDVPLLEIKHDTKKIFPKIIELEIDYKGLPSISYNKPKEIGIKIKNNSKSTLKGALTLKIPKNWEISPNKYTVEIPANKNKEYKFSISFSKSIKEISSDNKIEAILSGKNNQILASEIFGLAGENIWLVFGPFWTLVKSDPELAKLQHGQADNPNFAGLPTLNSMFSNDPGMDIKYLPEPEISWKTEIDLNSGLVFEKKIMSCPEDKIDLDNIFTMQGPAVLYLVQYVQSPENRKAWFMVGSNDMVKIWLNEKEVISRHSHNFAMPFNEGVEVDLKKGVNKIVIKVGRCGANFDFQFGIRECKKGYWHSEQWMIDISSVLPWTIDSKKDGGKNE